MILDFTKSEYFGVFMLVSVLILVIITIIQIVKSKKLEKRYKNFISKLSRGSNFEGMLREYIETVERVEIENKEIKQANQKIEKQINKCVQKIGIVRYNAFVDTGSDLCFALALLDFEDNGIVINGVYSRDNTTTTYAKPVQNGTSKYTLSKEETEAIEKAKQSSESYYIKI
ncbi:MAG: DUF4446 family protein [Clostridia bacterium]|nr:DUF4446 family protein [Clostridia bacterium]